MITGTLGFSVEVSVESEEKLAALSASIEKQVKALSEQGVISCEEVDSDVIDEDDIEDDGQ